MFWGYAKVVYECKEFPYSGYCKQDAFEPVGLYGYMAWNNLGCCFGTTATVNPTASSTTMATQTATVKPTPTVIATTTKPTDSKPTSTAAWYVDFARKLLYF